MEVFVEVFSAVGDQSYRKDNTIQQKLTIQFDSQFIEDPSI